MSALKSQTELLQEREIQALRSVLNRVFSAASQAKHGSNTWDPASAIDHIYHVAGCKLFGVHGQWPVLKPQRLMNGDGI